MGKSITCEKCGLTDHASAARLRATASSMGTPLFPLDRTDAAVPLRAVQRLMADCSGPAWKWRRRSPSTVMERTYEEATEALLAGRESRHPEAAFAGASAFEQKRPTNHSAEQERIAYLEKKIQIKDEV